jgi:Type II secretory pathway, prepilin signal peptidase PulO and related peptidases
LAETLPNWLVYGWTGFLENFWYVIAFIAGAVVGSFLGVVIYRLPIITLTYPRPKNFSLSHPASFCPHCNHALSWWENTPIFGFLILRGRCFDCKKPIPWRDFAMEILTASVWVALFHRYNEGNLVSWVHFVGMAFVASMLIAAVFIDLDHFIIPDELNWFGTIVGVVRDIACIALLTTLSAPFRDRYLSEFAYFGWLPRAIPGALLYGGVLWLVAFGSFLHYARPPWESVGAAARRFFTLADPPEPPAELKEQVEAAEAELAAEEQEAGDPIRLRFSPGFIVMMAAGFLAVVVKWWALLAVVLPTIAFVLLTRQPEESAGQALRRFFRADDLPYSYDTPPAEATVAAPTEAALPIITGTNPDGTYVTAPVTTGEGAAASSPSSGTETAETPHLMTVAEAQADADQFAREAETGAHGGMGLGDAKLALAIGAALGPFPAILSLLVATLIGAVTGVTLMRLHNKGTLRYGLPFGPFMAAGALLVMLYGEQAVKWYMSTLPQPEVPAASTGRPDFPQAAPPIAPRPVPPSQGARGGE